MIRCFPVLVPLLLLLAGCATPSGLAVPKASGGAMDLGAWNWALGPVPLDGQWTFDHRLQKVPADLGFGRPNYGAGTYGLRITVPAGSPPLALRLPIVGTAFELSVNGQVLAREGVVSATAAGAVPSYRPRLVLLPPAPDGILNLTIQVSNWNDQFAGLYYGISLGPWDQIEGQREMAVIWEAVIFGAIFLMGLYHCGSFFFRSQNRAPLWFGVFCLLMAARSTFYSEVLFLEAFPDASWFVVIRGVYLTMSLGLAAFAAFLDRLYPDLAWRPALWTSVAVGVTYGAVNLVAPVDWTTTALVPFQIYMLTFGIYSLVVVVRALVAREPGARLFIGGLALFLATIALDIFKTYLFWDIPSLVNIGFLAFVLAQALVVARLFARSFALAEIHSQAMEKINTSLERFIPREVLGFLGKNSITEIVLGDFSEMRMTVFFLDIRNFTTLSESMSPKDNFRFINSFLRKFGPLIRDHHGFVDKYIGDGIMALFPGAADDALGAAMAMREALKDYNDGRVRGGYVPVRFGIGIHTGPLMLGTIGENRRMDSTVISDTVNAASRLEGLTKKYETDILVSGHTVGELGNPDRFPTRFLAEEHVKGRSQPIEVFEVLVLEEVGLPSS